MFDPEHICQEVLRRVLLHYQQLGQYLSAEQQAIDTEAPFQSSPLRDDIVLLAQIANGDVARETIDEEMIAELFERMQRMVDILFVPAAGSSTVPLSSAFWSEPGIGQVLTHVHAWLRGDDLIGYTEAAHIFVSRSRKSEYPGGPYACTTPRRAWQAAVIYRPR